MPTRSKPSGSQCTGIKDPTNFTAVSKIKLPEFPIPHDLYIVLKMRMQEYPLINTKSRNYLKCLQSLSNVKEIPQDCYIILLKILLYVESFHKKMEKKKFNLHNWPITFLTITQCRIEVPNLNEDDPFVKEDEYVKLQFNRRSFMCKVLTVGLKYIVVEADPRMAKLPELRCEVKFIYSSWSEQCAHHALHLLNKYQFGKTFFPDIRPGFVHPDHEMYWINNKVGTNKEQQKAILNILDKTALPSPYILFGPPGTGKTATLVEVICQIWQKDPSTRVLVCAPSNAGADEITRRVLKCIPVRSVHRMYAPSVKGKDIDDVIKPCANIVDEQTVFLPKEVLLFKKVVISTLVSSARLWNLNLPPDHFSYIFIDEASQAIEPDALIPLSLIVGKQGPKFTGTLYGQIVLAGDPWQLGPVVQSKIVEHLLGVSMLERLMKLPPYRKNEMGEYNEMYITKLINNYRSNGAILHTSNKLFYENELRILGDEETQKALGWKRLPNQQCPIIFHHVHGQEEKINNSKSSYNAKEITVVVKYVKLLMNEPLGHSESKMQQENIGIVTPFRSQQYHIKKQLEKIRYSDITVGTVEVFQGQERDVIIVSTVRSQIFRNDDNCHIGFLSNPKRLNVALTRAKSLLIVVGNKDVLKTDQHWNEFIQYCTDNNAIIC